MHTLPSTFVVGPFTVSLWLCNEKELGNGNMGQFESEHLLIKIYRHGHPQAQAECTLHELWHVMYDQWFAPDSTPDEEEIVRFATSSMISLLRDNPTEITSLLELFDQTFPHLPHGKWAEVEP